MHAHFYADATGRAASYAEMLAHMAPPSLPVWQQEVPTLGPDRPPRPVTLRKPLMIAASRERA